MIKVRLHKPGANSFTMDVKLPVVPRIDETIAILVPEESDAGEYYTSFRVHGVHWYVGNSEFAAYVVLR